MKFLLDEDLPRSCSEVIKNHGHEVIRVVETGLRGQSDTDVGRYAREHNLCLITGDFGFGDIRNYPPSQHSGIVVLELQSGATASQISQLLDVFMQQSELLEQLTGKLAIVSHSKIRIRSDL